MAEVPPAPSPAPQPEHQTLVLTDPPPEKHHVLLWSLCVMAVALVTGGIVYAYWQVDSPAAEVPIIVTQEQLSTTTLRTSDTAYAYYKSFQEPDSESEPKYYQEIYRSRSYAFLCYVQYYTEVGCDLYVQRLSDGPPFSFNIVLSYGTADNGGFLPSPNGEFILIVQAKTATLINTETLNKKEIYAAEEGYELGLLSDFPSFLPQAQWLDDERVELKIYPENTFETPWIKNDDGTYTPQPTPEPTEIKIIDISSQI